jgi:hypothetical protein
LDCSALSKDNTSADAPESFLEPRAIERPRISGLISKSIDINRRHLVSDDSIWFAAAPPIKAASLVGGFAPAFLSLFEGTNGDSEW